MQSETFVAAMLFPKSVPHPKRILRQMKDPRLLFLKPNIWRHLWGQPETTAVRVYDSFKDRRNRRPLHRNHFRAAFTVILPRPILRL